MTVVVRLALNPDVVVNVEQVDEPIVRITGVTAAGPQGLTGPPGPTVPPYTETIGDGVTTVFPITHDLGTKDVIPHIYSLVDPFTAPLFTPKHATTNTITIEFPSPPDTDSIRVVVTSGGTGPGVPGGGLETEVLAKASNDDFDTAWAAISVLLPDLKGFVKHDTDPTVARPVGYSSIEWYGSVLPDNIDVDFDTWIDSS